MKLPESLFDIGKWGAFKITAIAVGVIALLLIFRDATKAEEMLFIQSLVKFAIGSSVISYCQSLSYSTYRLNKEAKDLPICVQIFFMLAQVGWFVYWFIVRSA